jgi:hypothetical protein
LFDAANAGAPIIVVASSAIAIFLILLSPKHQSALEAGMASALQSTRANNAGETVLLQEPATIRDEMSVT